MGDDEGIGTPGLGVMVHGVDQMLADKRSRTSYQRELHMMDKQNAMNLSNAKSMPMIQAEGLRMAGFNPAMVAGAGTSPAPTVSKGSADMAQTIPFDMASLAQLSLIDAQRENIEAQTEKTKAETEVVPTEGEKNSAQVLLYGKQAELTEEQKNKVKEEAQQIANTNKNYTDENERLKSLGQTVAKEWMRSDWYDKLPDHMKGYIEELASGKFDLTVGDLEAFDRLLSTQGNIGDKGKATMENTVLAEIAKKQLLNDESLTAIANLPVEEYRLKSNLADKTKEEITEVQQNIRKIQAEIGRIGVQNQLDEHHMDKLEADVKHIIKQIEQIDENDYGILIKNGKEGKLAAIATLNNLAAIIHTIGMFTPGGLVGKIQQMLGKKKSGSPLENLPPGKRTGGERPNYGKSYKDLVKEGKIPKSTSYRQGVQSMRFA